MFLKKNNFNYLKTKLSEKKKSRLSERSDKKNNKKIKNWQLKLRSLVSIKHKSLKLKAVLLIFAALFFIGFGGIIYILRDLPSPRKLGKGESYAVSTQIFDRNGELLYEIYGDENRIPVSLQEIPEHMRQATIAIEDKKFYKHFGFDLLGIIRAIKNTLLKQGLQGGSTITQQLVKNGLLTRERTIKRKVKEAVLTLATEILYSKDEILEMYLNYIPYGGTASGVEAAANLYFDKSAHELTLAESAFLAGLPQAPSYYSPFSSDPNRWKNRQKDVLRRMAEDGFITQEQADEAENTTLTFALSTTDIQAPHFVFYVRDWLIDRYGEDTVEKGGLRVTTTLDLQLQEVAQASLSAEISDLKRHKVGNGAALVTKPNTGEILAMIGSKDYFNATDDGEVNITIRERQPGSSIKPINLAIAFEDKKQTPASMILDVPTCFELIGQKPYCPKNYDGSFHGPVQQRFALANSYNIPAVKTGYINGVERFIDQATEMGITTWKDPSNYGYSLALGGGEVRMVDMAVAFGVLANQGVKVPLQPVLRIEDYQGNIIEEYKPQEKKEDMKSMFKDEDITMRGSMIRVMHRAPAYLVSHILLDNDARRAAFGSRSELVIHNHIVSAKTGTTNDLRDNWTVGYTPEYLTIVWVGNNDNTPMNRYLVSGVTGAAPIWNDIMSHVLRNEPEIIPERPGDVISVDVCSMSGLLPRPEASCNTRTELFWEGTEPIEMENIKKQIWVEDPTGFPVTGKNMDGRAVKLEEHTVISDPFVKDYCLDCVRPTNEEGKITYERYMISPDHELDLRIGRRENPRERGE